jgi:hypothetical protein
MFIRIRSSPNVSYPWCAPCFTFVNTRLHSIEQNRLNNISLLDRSWPSTNDMHHSTQSSSLYSSPETSHIVRKNRCEQNERHTNQTNERLASSMGVCKDVRPFTIVEDETFRQLAKELVSIGECFFVMTRFVYSLINRCWSVRYLEQKSCSIDCSRLERTRCTEGKLSFIFWTLDIIKLCKWEWSEVFHAVLLRWDAK